MNTLTNSLFATSNKSLHQLGLPNRVFKSHGMYFTLGESGEAIRTISQVIALDDTA